MTAYRAYDTVTEWMGRRRAVILHAVFALALGTVLALGAVAVTPRAWAEPQPALDRQLTERMVRALEAQARATERLAQATERCKH